MRYLSVCSGIEAASVAWHSLGWKPVAFSEIEPFPSAVLAHHYPNVPNYGDMTKFEEWPLEPGTVDLLVGGTPCQSFSVAGLRKGISDPRGGLMLTYLEIARRFRPRWIVWENVPGVLSSNGGRDFGSLLGWLEEFGYGWAYRVLDAQYCRVDGRWPKAVPQRRRRVFVVGCDLGRDPRGRERAAEVLALGTGLRWHLEAGAKTRKAVAADAKAGAGAGCYWDGGDIANTLTRKGCDDRMPDKDRLFAILQPIGYRWQNDRDGLVEDGTAPSCRASTGGSGFHEMNHPVVVHPFTKAKRAQSTTDDETWVDGQVNPRLSLFDHGDTRATTVAVGVDLYNQTLTDGVHCPLRTAGGHGAPAVAHAVAPTITAANDPSRSPQSSEVTQEVAAVHAASMTVRRLTPRECERLQGFPDDWTLIPWRGKAADQCPDGPRYRALGNSMACNCMAWIGERIAAVDSRNDL